MRGKEPTVECVFDEAGGEIREILLELFRRFLEREAGERDRP